MIDSTAEREARRGTWRRSTFWAWIGTAVVAVVVILALVPFGPYFGERFWGLGLIVMPVLLLMLASGLGWLAYRVTRKPHQH